MIAPAMERLTRSESETIELARVLARSLRPGDVVALHGDLGAGKTRFVRGLAEGLGIDPSLVNSPTYVLVHEHGAGSRAIPLIHVDAYRLTTDDDLETLDWERLIEPGAGHVLVIEWAERIPPGSLPDEHFAIAIVHAGDNSRRISITPPPGRGA